jgi:lytic murein transglycosylase
MLGLCIVVSRHFLGPIFRHQKLVLLPQLWHRSAQRRARVSHWTVCRGLFLLPAAFAAALLIASPAQAESPPARDFKSWLDELKPAAKAAGVSEAGFDRIVNGIAPNCGQTGVFCDRPAGEPPEPSEPSFTERTGLPKSCDKVSQREFLEPGAYFPEDYLRRLVSKGQTLLEDLRTNQTDAYRHVLRIEQTYGVPVPILMGLWARETSFGDATLSHNAVVALASLAFAGQEHRRAYMRRQFIAALKMVDEGAIAFDKFRSSWAGATGLTQIMPEEYLQYAVDGDGDGVRDIWTSPPDALATTANVLSRRGWKPHGGWGREVVLPETADCTLEGRANGRPLGSWAQQFGVLPVDRGEESAGPVLSGEESSYLLMPAGTLGPTFLASDNFDVLRAYNPSDLYALFIGTVGDRLGCDTQEKPCPFSRPWPETGGGAFEFSVENICRLQLNLKDRGFLNGEADGLFGPQTRAAIGRYQKAQGRKPTCYPNRELYEQLRGSLKAEAMHKQGMPATP